MAPFPRGADRGYAARRRRRFRGRAPRGGLRQCLQVGVCARVLLWGVSFAVSESQRPDDLVCFVQRRRSGACLAWCRGFRHCYVAVSKSRGRGADVPWLVRWCVGALLGVRAVDGHPRGGAFQCCEGRPVLGAVPPPAARPPERAARVPRPACPGRGRCGQWTLHRPHSVCPCGPALLAVGVAGGRPRGGVPSTVVRGAWCQALSLPRPLVLRSVQPGFRDPCVPGAVDAGMWTQHRPHSVRPCGPALLAVGVAEGRPRGGAFHRCEGRLVSGAVPPPAALALRSVQPGFRDPCVPGAVDVGVWTQYRPHGVRPCGPALFAVGVAEGRPRGGLPSTVVRGAWCQALSLPRPLVLRSVQPGSATRVSRARSMRAVDPAPAPQRAPLRADAARCGGGGRASPGGVPSTVVRGAWCQALSLPRPLVFRSVQPGFRDPRVPGAVDAGVWTQHRPHSVRPCGPVLLAVGVAEGRPRGGCLPPL